MLPTIDIQTKEDRNSHYATMEYPPTADTVVFLKSEIRKKDFLQFVFFSNEELISCYQNAVQRVRGIGRKKLILNMLERKTAIKEKFLAELAESGHAFTGKINRITSSAVKYLLDTDLRPVNSILDVYAFILKKEQRELELFTRLAELEENQEVKEIFLEQSQVCKEHISDLEVDFTAMTLEAASCDIDMSEF